MPIEYSTDTEEVEDSTESSAAETSHLPISLLAGKTVGPGDVVRLEVVNVDEDGGFVEVRYAMDKKKGSAIEDAAAVFNPVKDMEAM